MNNMNIYHYLNVDEFLNALKNEAPRMGIHPMIAAHQRNDVPLNFEVMSSDRTAFIYIYLSYTDVGVMVDGPKLYKAMEQIATFINNDLNCGCTFTIG